MDRDLYDAARMSDTDWQLWYLIRRDGVGTLLPDLQKTRALAEVLRTRTRGAIAAGDTADALHTLKIHFALAKTLEANPTLIGHLVGVAIATIACHTFLKNSSKCSTPARPLTPASPTSPRPFDLRLGIQGGRTISPVHFDRLLKATCSLPDDEMANVMQFLVVLIALSTDQPAPGSRDLATEVPEVGGVAKRVEQARARLLATGFQPAPIVDLTKEFGLRNVQPVRQRDRTELVKSMTPIEAVVTDDIRQYEVWRDEQLKWMTLPHFEAMPGIQQVQTDLEKQKDDLLLAELPPAGDDESQSRPDPDPAATGPAADRRSDPTPRSKRTAETARHARRHQATHPRRPVTGKPFE